jgi:3-dehydroquinate synthase
VKQVQIKVHPNHYRVFVGDGALDRLPALAVKSFREKGRCVVATDSHLAGSLGRRAVRALRSGGWDPELYALPRGEAAKSLSAHEKFLGFLLRKGVERRTPVFAVGGGTVGDAAGFAAAVYYRGIPVVQVPTTLLAQVDSAIGGKTAINHPAAKNAVGAFHQPSLVVCDTAVLKSLPRRDFLSGLGEVVKYAMVFDPAFGRRLRLDWLRVLQREEGVLERVVARCAAIKGGVVAADVRDLKGRRELLNFGHTLGHALETASNYRVRHGEAVAWGMRAAVAISKARGWIKKPEPVDDLLSLLPRVRVPRGISMRKLLEPLKSDKKARRGRNVFVLLKEIGRPVRVDDVARHEIESAVEAVEGS